MTAGVEIEMDVSAAVQRLQRIGKDLNADQLLKIIGQRFLTWINLNFKQAGTEEKWPPLRPNTIASRRGTSAQILRDTGRLAQSFTSRLDGSEAVSVGTENQIARFHNEGTKPYTIVPKKPGGRLVFMTVDGPVFAKKVHHPGLPRRRLIPSDQLANRIALETVKKTIDRIVERSGGG